MYKLRNNRWNATLPQPSPASAEASNRVHLHAFFDRQRLDIVHHLWDQIRGGVDLAHPALLVRSRNGLSACISSWSLCTSAAFDTTCRSPPASTRPRASRSWSKAPGSDAEPQERIIWDPEKTTSKRYAKRCGRLAASAPPRTPIISRSLCISIAVV